MFVMVLRADTKPIVDGAAARCAAAPSISVLTYLRIAISALKPNRKNLKASRHKSYPYSYIHQRRE